MKEFEPDLVLTDVVMSGPMSGLTLAETLRMSTRSFA